MKLFLYSIMIDEINYNYNKPLNDGQNLKNGLYY